MLQIAGGIVIAVVGLVIGVPLLLWMCMSGMVWAALGLVVLAWAIGHYGWLPTLAFVSVVLIWIGLHKLSSTFEDHRKSKNRT